MRRAHYRTCSMARKLKITENDKHTLQDLKYGQKTLKKKKKRDDEKCTVQDLEYDEKTENH